VTASQVLEQVKALLPASSSRSSSSAKNEVEPATSPPVAVEKKNPSVPVPPKAQIPKSAPKKDFETALLLATWFGWAGADRFYLRKPGTGFLKLILGYGGFGIWWIYDIVQILKLKATDGLGNSLVAEPDILKRAKKRTLIVVPLIVSLFIGIGVLGALNKSEEADKFYTVPSLVGMNLGDAKSSLENIETLDLDASGEGRSVLWSSNWKICSQTPKSGQLEISEKLTLNVVKVGETCPD
jgi:TM2 domain-containing membrane protein YozV